MEQKTKTGKKISTTNYASPRMQVVKVYLEQSIAAGSAKIWPTDTSHVVQEEWEIGEDRTTDLPW